MLYVRSLEMPSYRRMSLVGESARLKPGPTTDSGPATDPRTGQGAAIYTQLCSACHGPGQTAMRSPSKLGRDTLRALLRQGVKQMPAFSEAMLPTESVNALEAFLLSLPVADEQAGREGQLQLPQNPARYAGPSTRYAGSFSAGWYTGNGYPAVGPPWTQLVAYDLNEADDGRVLWERELEANPEGIPAIYEVRGRQYVVFAAGASWGTGGDPVWRNALHRKQGKIEAQGYHVFALPAR